MATTMQPEQALFLHEWMIGALKLEHPITRRVIDAIPVDKGLYRLTLTPTPRGDYILQGLLQGNVK